jgi:hypothetical protein
VFFEPKQSTPLVDRCEAPARTSSKLTLSRYRTFDNSPVTVSFWPGVYLDHWPFRRFSQNPELRRALVDALVDREGTLVIGRLNLLEFTRVQGPAHLQAAEDLVQAVLPRVFLLDVQIMDVVNRENAGRDFGACGDPADVRAFLADPCSAIFSDGVR